LWPVWQWCTICLCYRAPETTRTKHQINCTTVTWDWKRHVWNYVVLKKISFSPYDEYLNFTKCALYIYEVRLWNHCYSGKAITITCSECAFLDLGIQHAMHMHHIVCNIFPHCIINSMIFWWGWRSYWTQNMFWFSLQFVSESV